MENISKHIDVLIPIIKERELNFKSFVMGFHEYRNIWQPKSNEILEVKMEPTNKMDKFTVAVIKNKQIIGHIPFGKTERFSKTNFYFLKCEYIDCKIKIVDDKAVNLGDGIRMRVPCLLEKVITKWFLTQECFGVRHLKDTYNMLCLNLHVRRVAS